MNTTDLKERNLKTTASAGRQPDLVLTRLFNAPRPLVFQAFTEPQHLARWWGPNGFTTPECEVQARPGGAYNLTMRGPDGQLFPGKGVIQEIVAPERLVFTNGAFEDAAGNQMLQVLTTLTFEALGERTKLTLEAVVLHSTPETAQALAGMEQGWSQSLDKLADLVEPAGTVYRADTQFVVEPGKQEVVMSRVFDAPRARLFKAYTDPELIARWWGPRQYVTMVEKLEARPGGMWRFFNFAADGTSYGFHGFYHEVAAPERLVYTFEFEGTPGHVVLETVTLEELPDGKTRMTDLAVFQSVADRDAMTAEGMQAGAVESTERLAELMARIAANHPEG